MKAPYEPNIECPYHFLSETEQIDTGRYGLAVLINWLSLATEIARDEVEHGHLYCKGPKESPPRGSPLLLRRATTFRRCAVGHFTIE